MLNTFPILLSFALFVPFIFRISIVLFFIAIALDLKDRTKLTQYFKERNYPFANIVSLKIQVLFLICALFIGIGLFTQITALVALTLLMFFKHINKKINIVEHSETTFTFIILICFSLLFLGAGVFAFDLPL